MHILLQWLGGWNTWGFKHSVEASRIQQPVKELIRPLNETPPLSHPELISGWNYGMTYLVSHLRPLAVHLLP